MGLGNLRYGQIMMCLYMKVSLSDFLTVFCARTHEWFGSRRPAVMLFLAFITATSTSTLLSKYWEDVFGSSNMNMNKNTSDMEGLSWAMILFVWVYCLIWFVIQDICKVALYKL